MRARSQRPRGAVPDDTRKPAWLAAIAIAALTAVVYAGVAGHRFIGIDDPEYIVNNVRVAAGLTASGAAWAFTTTHAANWHPVTWLSHMLDVELFGLDPGAHHLVNLTLHVVNAVLLLFVLRLLTGATWRSAIVAALFAVHPLHVESVAWVSERKDVLSTCLLLLTLAAYIRSVRQPSAMRTATALALYAAGLMTKPMLVTVPILLVFADLLPGDGGWAGLKERFRGSLRRTVPYFALAAASSAVTLIAQTAGGAVGGFERFPWPRRLGNALVTTVDYLVRMVWPVDLSPFYPYPAALGAGSLIASAVVVAGLTLGAVWLRGRQPYLLLGWLWYLVTLAPVIGIIQVGSQASADRYTYVPLIGVFVAIVWGAALLVRTRAARRAAAAVAVGVVMALAVVARAQVGHWRDDVALWTKAVDATRHLDNHSVEYALGVALRQRGDVDGAIAHHARAAALQPSFAAARYELGIALLARDRPADAIPHLEAVVALEPAHATAQHAVAEAYMRAGRPADALRHVTALVAREPRRADHRYRLGVTLLALGRRDDAIARFDEALRLDPSFEAARQARASLDRVR